MKIRFLIIRLSSIGDIVLTSPVVRCLKNQVENAEIHYVTKHRYAPLLQGNPYIHKLHLYDGNLHQLAAELQKEQIDYIIDLHQNFRSNRLKRYLNVPAFSFEKLNIQKWLMVNLKINRLPEVHIVDRYMKTVSVFDVENDGKGLDYFIPENDNLLNGLLSEETQSGYIAFVIGGTYATKRLPPSKIVEICSQLRQPIILIGGRREKTMGEEIAGLLDGRVINLTGKTSLSESAWLIREARLVLTNDTGLMHIAAAFRKKVLSFWGNTVPGFGMYPYQPHPISKIIEVGGLKCRPCSKLGFDKCPRKHFRCMVDIPAREAVDWVNANF